MMSNTSTVVFRSNLYPISRSFFSDHEFYAQIHDPFCLEIFKDEMVAKKIASMTPLQEQEYNVASRHCIYADRDDYPFGTIKNGDAPKRVVCKCLNTRCSYFKRCRPNFNPDELSVLEENKKARLVIFNFENAESNRQIDTAAQEEHIPEPSTTIKDDFKTAAQEERKPAVAPESPTTIKDDFKTAAQEERKPAVAPEPSTAISKPAQAKQINFNSFADTTQENIIEAEPEERSVINAAPGTGKTWTLIEKIIYMLNEKKVAADEILVLCFSRSATETIKNRLVEAAENGRVGYEWQDVDVRTFDSFSTYMLVYLQDNNSELLPQPFVLEDKDYEQRIKIAASVFEKTKEMLKSCRHIIVDEVQDLVGSRAELVLAMLKSLPDTCGFTILGDSCQALYDYLAQDDSSLMTSEQFYKNIFLNFADANYYSLKKNHRQNYELENLATPYREAILDGSLLKCALAADNLLANIKSLPVKLHKFNLENANKYEGTLGILTRTNGQALQISAWLRNEGVPHILKRGMSAQTLAGWIAKIFYDCKDETIDENGFLTLYREHFSTTDDDVAKKNWQALTSTQRKLQSRYEISDLLKGLLRNARDPLLYESDTDKNCTITVSNIHRAKGQEFDSVIVLDDVIENMANPENKNILEHKVCYVALTRPKKKIERAEISDRDKQIYITKNEDLSSRCSKARIRKKKSLSHFEVGSYADLEPKSFAVDESRQRYIQENIFSGMRLRLIKCPEETKSYVVYKIVLEDDWSMVLGYTGKAFAHELEKAMQHIIKLNCSVYYRVYPNAFCDVYVQDTVTYISVMNIPDGAKTFGDVGIWSGIKIIGFASVDRDTY